MADPIARSRILINLVNVFQFLEVKVINKKIFIFYLAIVILHVEATGTVAMVGSYWGARTYRTLSTFCSVPQAVLVLRTLFTVSLCEILAS